MLINVDKLSQTRWGKNRGTFDCVDWVSNTDIETFFGYREQEKYSEYSTDIKSYFDTVLLIFEWGTTWLYTFVPAFDAASPIVGQIGSVMRVVIMPTIVKKADLNH